MEGFGPGNSIRDPLHLLRDRRRARRVDRFARMLPASPSWKSIPSIPGTCSSLPKPMQRPFGPASRERRPHVPDGPVGRKCVDERAASEAKESTSCWPMERPPGRTVFHVHLHVIPRFPGDNLKIIFNPLKRMSSRAKLEGLAGTDQDKL